MADDTFLIFARVWCGFLEDFPFEDYDNEHSDGEVTRRLEAECRICYESSEPGLDAHIQSIRDGRDPDLGRGRTSTTPAEPLPGSQPPLASEPPPDVSDDDEIQTAVPGSLLEMLYACGWRSPEKRRGFVFAKRGGGEQIDPLFLPRVFLATEVPGESVALAMEVIRTENEGKLTGSPAALRLPVVVRFGLVATSSLSPAERLTAQRQVQGSAAHPNTFPLPFSHFAQWQKSVHSILDHVNVDLARTEAEGLPEPVKEPTEKSLTSFLTALRSMAPDDQVSVGSVIEGYGLVRVTPPEFMSGTFVGRKGRALKPHQLVRPSDDERQRDDKGLLIANAQAWPACEVIEAVLGWFSKLGIELPESTFG